MRNMSDEMLCISARSGNIFAFDILIDRWEKKIYSLACRMLLNKEDAEDAAQDIFLKVYSKIHMFNGNSSFKTWLYSVALNSINDHIRKSKRKHSMVGDDELNDKISLKNSDDKHNPFENMKKEQSINYLKQSLNKLPEKQKTVLILKEYNELTFEEIADVVRCPVSTVKSRLYKGLENLRLHIEGAL